MTYIMPIAITSSAPAEYSIIWKVDNARTKIIMFHKSRVLLELIIADRGVTRRRQKWVEIEEGEANRGGGVHLTFVCNQ